jgi:UDP-N-acetylmuramate dehydrogenase
MSFYDSLAAEYPGQVRLGEALAKYTVARLGGPATAVFLAKTPDQLIVAVQGARQAGLAWRVLGGGANVLAADEGFRGLLIVNQAKQFRLNAQTGEVWAESGVNLTTLARVCMGEGMKGLEWGVSVPGTLGGAVVNNAGAHGGDMAGNLSAAEVYLIATGERATWLPATFEYAYRHSCLKGHPDLALVLSLSLKLDPGHPPAELQAIAEDFIEHRKRTQPPGASLGSMFKNPPGDYAGRLIEAAGLKGLQHGGVQISPLHANFFINLGGGTAADYQALIAQAQAEVRARFGVMLELEIERLGDWP